jgi:hypothetical protein
MKSMLSIPAILVVLFAFAQPVPAQDFFVFPSQGQSDQQMQRDKADCQVWARQQTGFDPLATPRATAPPPSREAPQGGLVRGGARGAALGAVGGAIAGDAGRGAAIGAGTGALLGAMRRSDQIMREEQSHQQWARQQNAQQSQERDRFNRAFRTCLEGKGYRVN